MEIFLLTDDVIPYFKCSYIKWGGYNPSMFCMDKSLSEIYLNVFRFFNKANKFAVAPCTRIKDYFQE